MSPRLSLSLASPFCCLTSSHPAPEAPAQSTNEDPFWCTGARAAGTWEDGPGGAPAGHEGGAGAQEAAELVLVSHSARLCLVSLLSLSTSLRVSPRPSVSRSTSLSLSLHVSVFQLLEHSHQLYEICFSTCLEVHPLHTGKVSKVFSGDQRETDGRKENWKSLWGPLEVKSGGVNNSNNCNNHPSCSFDHNIPIRHTVIALFWRQGIWGPRNVQ